MKHILKQSAAFLFALAFLFLSLQISEKAAAAEAYPGAGTVSVSWGSLNVRSSPSVSGTVVAALPKGAAVTLLSRADGFFKVEYAAGKFGYASASYISVLSGTAPATVVLSSGSLNVRSGPSTSYAVKAVLPGGKSVVVLSKTNGWSRILYNGNQFGYVSSSYLSVTAASSALRWPVPKSTKVVQRFTAGSHLGIDIAPAVQGVAGDPIVSASSGTVVYAGTLSGYGYVVYVNSVINGRNLQLRYAHLKSAPLIRAGQTVNSGQLLGYMGNTGTSTGVHLHFEVRVRASSLECLANSLSTPQDPLLFVSP